MTEQAQDFPVFPFIQELFEDLTLTLPSLGCHFEGVVTSSDQTIHGRRIFVKNKLFLLFADLAQGRTQLKIKFTMALLNDLVELCFVVPEGSQNLSFEDHPSWDPEIFHLYRQSEGPGFAFHLPPGKPLQSGPILDWRELYRLYGSPTAGKTMLEAFLKRAEELVPALGKSINTGDLGEVQRLSHTLKGSARGVFAVPFSSRAHKLEMMSRGGNLNDADTLYKNLCTAYDELISFYAQGDS